MWMRVRFWFSGFTVAGVTMKTRTPSMVDFSTLTCMRSSRPGRFLIVPSAPASASGFHSSPVFGSTFQPLRNGAAISFCTCGLTSPCGTGRVLAGTSSPCAKDGVVSVMVASARSDARRAMKASLFVFGRHVGGAALAHDATPARLAGNRNDGEGAPDQRGVTSVYLPDHLADLVEDLADL